MSRLGLLDSFVCLAGQFVVVGKDEDVMKADWFVKLLLFVITISLGAIALGPYVAPSVVVSAQAGDVHPLYFEPGTYMLRAPDGSQQVYGKVAVDMRNGKIWGFPTFTQDPYPSNPTASTPPTSHPFLLGKFALSEIDK
jgi:hypothetical protein